MFDDYDYDMEAVAMSTCGKGKGKNKTLSPAEKKTRDKRKMTDIMNDFERFASQVAKCKMGTAKDKAPILKSIDSIRSYMADMYGK